MVVWKKHYLKADIVQLFFSSHNNKKKRGFEYQINTINTVKRPSTIFSCSLAELGKLCFCRQSLKLGALNHFRHIWIKHKQKKPKPTKCKKSLHYEKHSLHTHHCTLREGNKVNKIKRILLDQKVMSSLHMILVLVFVLVSRVFQFYDSALLHSWVPKTINQCKKNKIIILFFENPVESVLIVFTTKQNISHYSLPLFTFSNLLVKPKVIHLTSREALSPSIKQCIRSHI